MRFCLSLIVILFLSGLGCSTGGMQSYETKRIPSASADQVNENPLVIRYGNILCENITLKNKNTTEDDCKKWVVDNHNKRNIYTLTLHICSTLAPNFSTYNRRVRCYNKAIDYLKNERLKVAKSECAGGGYKYRFSCLNPIWYDEAELAIRAASDGGAPENVFVDTFE